MPNIGDTVIYHGTLTDERGHLFEIARVNAVGRFDLVSPVDPYHYLRSAGAASITVIAVG